VALMVGVASGPYGICCWGFPATAVAAEADVEASGSCSIAMALPGAAPLLLARDRPEFTPDDQIALEDISPKQQWQQQQQRQQQLQKQKQYSVQPQQPTQIAIAGGKSGAPDAEETKCDCIFILYEEHQCEQSPHVMLSGWDVHNSLGQAGKLASSLKINKVGCNITIYADRGLRGTSATYEGIEENSCFDLWRELDDNAGSAITSDRCPLPSPPSVWSRLPTTLAPTTSCRDCTMAWTLVFISLAFAVVSLAVSIACCLCPRLFGSKVSSSSRIIQVN